MERPERSRQGCLGLKKVEDNTGRDVDKLIFAHGRVLKLFYSVFATICASFFFYKSVYSDCVIGFVKYLNVFCLCVFGNKNVFLKNICKINKDFNPSELFFVSLIEFL